VNTKEFIEDLKKNGEKDAVRNTFDELVAAELIRILTGMGARVVAHGPKAQIRVQNVLKKYTSAEVTRFLQLTRELPRAFFRAGVKEDTNDGSKTISNDNGRL